ncbi:MAG: TIM barrel protein [Planctomycetota bacterium]|nr:TIM barrel protein [Planctomycetota bacterium]
MKRRHFLAVPAVAASVSALPKPSDAVEQKKGRARQSVMGWCFKPMSPTSLAKHAKAIGLEAIEGIPASSYPEVTELGLKISLVGSNCFATGPLDPENHAEVEKKLRESIDLAVRYGAPNVITFTGMQKTGISDSAARKNCLTCWKRVIRYAEENQIGLVLEHLNSKDDSHPMKGHPGYWGDDLHLCAELVKSMDSPYFKLLFDMYHVQIMHGDLIRNIEKYQDIVGHYHTAGNPGRGELDDTQEINYPPVIRSILDTGYQGFIAQEFIPTSNDPIQSLRDAYELCDV